MLNDITLGQYFPGDSPIHRLDPRVKIVLMAAYFALVFLVKGFFGYVCIGLYVLAGALISKVGVRYLVKGLKPILVLILISVGINMLLTPGETVWWKWWIFTLSLEGVRTAAYFACRLIFLVLGTSLLTLTTSPIALTDALERLFGPLKKIGFPVHELAMMMTIALRFIPTLLGETDKIVKAQMARGADFESGNIIRRAKAMIPLLVPLFLSAFRRADELALAMEARCYHGGEGRTRMKVLRVSSLDFIAIGVTLLLAGLIVLEKWLL